MADENSWSLSAIKTHFPSSYEDITWKSCTLGHKLPINRKKKVFDNLIVVALFSFVPQQISVLSYFQMFMIFMEMYRVG